MRIIVRTTPRAEPLEKGNVQALPSNGGDFEVGGRSWRFVDYGRFATITTSSAGPLPLTVIVIPAAAARSRAARIGADLDRGLAPSDGTFRKVGALPVEGGGLNVAQVA